MLNPVETTLFIKVMYGDPPSGLGTFLLILLIGLVAVFSVHIWVLIITWRENKKGPAFVYAFGLLVVAVEICIRTWDPPLWSQPQRAETLYAVGAAVMATGAVWASVICFFKERFLPSILAALSVLIVLLFVFFA